MNMPFPVNGLHRGLPAENQPEGTSFDLLNVRPYDVTSERIRGGQRPALVKAYTTQISAASHPVLLITAITTTYIPPS